MRLARVSQPFALFAKAGVFQPDRRTLDQIPTVKHFVIPSGPRNPLEHSVIPSGARNPLSSTCHLRVTRPFSDRR